LAPPTTKSAGKLHRIGQKLGVGSAELPAGTTGRRPEIAIFGLFLQNRRFSSANFIQFANIWLK
jgi:hypothetical protein